MNRLKYIAAALIFPLLIAGLMAGSSPARAQANAESSDLAYFAALMQYIRSQPTPADVKSANIPVLSTLDTALSDIYITGFITPYTGETPEQVKARLQSVPEEDRFTAVMVESYRLASNPLLLNIIHELLPLYYVEYFTTAEDLNTSSEFLKSAEIATLAAAFDSTDYAIPAPSTTGAASPSAQRQDSVDSDYLAKFAAIMQYIRSQPTPADVKSANIPVLSTLDTALSDIYVTGFITPYTGETPEQVKARLQSVPEEKDRFTAVIVESYRLASNPLLLNIIHQLLPLYYVEYFTTAEDLNASAEFLKRAEIATLADAFDPTDYHIPAPSADESADTGSPEMDRAALVALYNATDGPNWTWNDNWASDAPLREWASVDVDEDGRVVSLGLWGNQLSGSIPPELGDLTSLENLYLRDNQLSGSIPPELGDLTNLETLDLSDNGLSGSIPPELGDLTNLENLDLSDNGLSGSIPPELGDLTSLETLDLSDNGLSGSIPPELGDLTNLENLYLSDNQLSGCIPNALGDTLRNDFSGLELSFCASRASDPADKAVLQAFYNATGGRDWSTNTNWLSDQPMGLWYGVATDSDGRVTGLSFRMNDLSGSIPTDLVNLSNLEYLDLIANELSDSIPSSLGNLTKLRYLYLGNNDLSGAIPPELGKLVNLESLYLSNNDLSGPIPSELGNLSNLTSLYLTHNDLSGPIPSELGNLTNLQFLQLSENRLNGPLPQELTKLTELRNFLFYNPQLCAPEDEAFQTWLRGLDYWNGNSCAALADRAVLEAIYHATDGPNWATSANWLSDRPPWEWEGVSTDDGRVTGVWLGGNDLSGSIPPEVGNLVNLKSLYLSNNDLSGPIPTELGNLVNLEDLDLGSNRLSGSLPPELGGLTNLKYISIHGNLLTDPIPQNLTAITGLEHFYFGDNDGLCAPTDAVFQTWLQAIPNWSGPDCEQVEAIASDRAALVALYNATDGPNWSTSDNWLSDRPLWDWEGVSTDDGRVTGVWLGGNDLSGSIPSELGKLTKLRRLYLDNNYLSGPIPTELGNLANLEELLLGGNELTGCIPNASGDTLNNDLYRLGLSFCDPRISDTSDKAVLEAFYNATGGPKWNDTTNWLSEEPMGLWRGVATDSDGRVTALNLDYNRLSGSIPTKLGDLVSLRRLNLSHNFLSGSIPPQLGNLANLEYLNLGDNLLSNSIPPQLGNLANLEVLRLHDNQLTGGIPSQLGNLANLEWVEFGGNQLTGCIPLALQNVRDDLDDELGLDFCAQ